MRAWARIAAATASRIADRPATWLPGALAWLLSGGWVALVAGVVRVPSEAELTFFGAGFYTSGAWPWNLVAVVVAAAILVVLAALGASLAEATLLAGERGRRVEPGLVGRLTALALTCALPAALAVAALGVAIRMVAPAEFSSPFDGGGPVVRIALRVAPLLGALGLSIAAGAAIHAAAARSLVEGAPMARALAAAPGQLARHAARCATHVVALGVARIGLIVLVAILLHVLWAPIEERLALDGIDVAVVLLLVGFVAIWLCAILAGGALHAWGSATWTGVLGDEALRDAGSREGMETPTAT